MTSVSGSWAQISHSKSRLYFISFSLIIHSINAHSKVLNTIKSTGSPVITAAKAKQMYWNTVSTKPAAYQIYLN